MKLAYGNMLHMECDALVITTNGFVKNNGDAVMGRGIAKQVADVLPQIPSLLGTLIKRNGNGVQRLINHNGMALISAPVKPAYVIFDGTNVVEHAAYRFRIGDRVPGFWAKAIPERIVASCHELVNLANNTGWQTILCPRFGCGAGELNWEDIEPLVSPILDDRFIVCTFKE